MNHTKNNTITDLSLDFLSHVSGGVDSLPDLSSLIIHPELYPYLPTFPVPLPVPSPAPDHIFWPNMPFIYPF